MTFDIRKEDGATKGRFTVTVDGHEAELTYSRLSPTRIIADHTGVPEALGGKGVGLALVEALVADARATGTTVVPLCPFVNAQLARHPAWSDVFEGA
ncbi:GNAT family N-acetyltransferase [Pseudooceanicola onchidii]|uniref:GNAT family N-acetyltransferase n=1 Tax=Pseudooceanicola onchidii TaxID=2562279 RepID=UPI0010AABE6A|nr:GNAT family N-acetyltransferase [Pseudooceanicola onchidii]